ncbi:MAG: hypothetical protein SFY68_04225 [Candidatus Sumerlaeia bacterium]|nr:hypothetical protein [Candidatus Sumerlaeia bacterium]
MINKFAFPVCALLAGLLATAEAQVLYQTSFENSVSTGNPVAFTPGDLNNKNNWQVVQGTATVGSTNSGAVGAAGAQSVSQGTNSIIRYGQLNSGTSNQVLVRGKWFGAGSQSLSLPNTSSPIAALVGFLSTGASTFTVRAYNGTTQQFVGAANPTNFSSTRWHDIDLRIDYSTKTFDVRVNGAPYILDIPFATNTINALSGFESHAESSSQTDRLIFIGSNAASGDFDGDGVTDKDEFRTAGRDPFRNDGSPTLDLAYNAPAIPVDELITDLQVTGGGDRWFKLEFPTCENIAVNALFSHAQNNINIELYDSRCRQAGNALSIFQYRIGEGYSTDDNEFITYANNRGNNTLYLRVFENSGNTGTFNLRVDPLGADDVNEFNSGFDFARSTALGTYNNLVTKDDDFFLVNTTGLNTLRVRVEHDFNLGQLYWQVFNAPNFGAFIGGNFTPNTNVIQGDVNVAGLNQVYVRVYNANLGANFYNLTLSNPAAPSPEVSTAELAPGLDLDSLTQNFFVEEPTVLDLSSPSSVAINGNEDNFEPNNNVIQAVNATPINIAQPVNGVLNDEDWYKIPMDVCENLRFDVDFVHANGDINFEVYDSRCVNPNGTVADGNAVNYRVGFSYSTDDDESSIYVNNTNNEFVYVRVFAQNAEAVGDSYTLTVTPLGTDDAFENGGTPNSPFVGLPLNQTHTNLVSKDDDYFRLNVGNANTIRVTLSHNQFLGQLFMSVLQDDGSFTPFVSAGRSYNDFRFNENNLIIDNIDVSGVDTVNLRVFAANRGTNVYDLRVEVIN